VKYKHPRSGSAVIVLSYFTLAMFLFRIPPRATHLRPLLDLTVIYLPMIIFYYSSRLAELEADRESVVHTEDAEAAIRGLAKLYRCTSVPTEWNGVAAIFQTHPSLTKRVSAMAKVGELSQDRAAKILAESGALSTAR
jgi:Zn-dependent protease with chaperone function